MDQLAMNYEQGQNIQITKKTHDNRPVRLGAIPLKLDFCLTRLATGADYDFIVRRFKAESAKFGTAVKEQAGRLVFELR